MKQKSILILAIATLAVGGVAALKLSSDEAAVASRGSGDRFLDGLMKSITANDVASIRLERKGGVSTLARGESGWGLAERNGYPVEAESVNKMLIALAEMKVLEEKTDDPARYAKLGVEDPEGEGSTSTRLTLTDKAGKELARVIVGKQSEGRGGMQASSTYVRRAGEKRSYLVRGELGLKEKDTDWLQKKILEVKRDRIRSVDVRHPDGEVVHVERGKAEDQNFELANIPDDQELSYPSAPGSITSTLEYLNLEDVVPAEKVDFTQGVGATSEFRTFDGLTVRVVVKEEGEKCYARFEAAYEAPPAIGPAPAPAEGEKPAEDGAPAAVPAPPKADPQKQAEEVRREAEQLQQRLSRWVYEIPAYNKPSFTKRMKDLLKAKAPPAPPPEQGDAGAGSDTYKIPDNLPPEIQQQIKADLEAKGHKSEVVPAPKPAPESTPPPAPAPTPPHEHAPGEPPHDA